MYIVPQYSLPKIAFLFTISFLVLLWLVHNNYYAWSQAKILQLFIFRTQIFNVLFTSIKVFLISHHLAGILGTLTCMRHTTTTTEMHVNTFTNVVDWDKCTCMVDDITHAGQYDNDFNRNGEMPDTVAWVGDVNHKEEIEYQWCSVTCVHWDMR